VKLTSLDTPIEPARRYVVRETKTHTCCFSAEVVDTSKGETVCSCDTGLRAGEVCAALNEWDLK